MTQRYYVPISTSLPFDSLIEFRKYKWTIRSWVPPCDKLQPAYRHFIASFVMLSSAGRGEQLRVDVLHENGKGETLYRAQVLNVEDV